MNEQVHTLAGAYALDALDEGERAELEALMATSPELRAEVESLQEAAALLGGAAAVTPPEGLRRAVMERVDVVRQDRPVVPLEASARSRRAQVGRWQQLVTRGAAAAAVLVAVGLGLVVAQLSSRVDEVQRTSQEVAALVVAEDAERMTTAVQGGGQLTAVLSRGMGAAVVVGDGLPALPPDRMYALWAIDGGTPVPAGELLAEGAVTMSADMEAVGLTVEPRGPLDLPTGEVIALLGA